MERIPRGDWVAGATLILVGMFLLVARVAPGIEQFVPLAVGLGLLAIFLVVRSRGALVAGGIVTGIGVGILVAVQPNSEFGGAGFLLSVGGGFILVSLLAAIYEVPGTRAWPVVPGSVLIAVGAIIYAARMGRTVLELAATWWPAALVAIGFYVIGVARLRMVGSYDDESTTPSRVPTTARSADEEGSRQEQPGGWRP